MQAASAHRSAGNLAEAEPLLKSALAIQREIETSSMAEAIGLNELAYLYLELGRIKESLLNVERALEIFDENGLSGIDRAMVLDTKAQALAAGGKSDSAARLFDEVMSVAVSATPEEQRVLYKSYETFLRDQNRTSEALEIRRKIDLIDGRPVSDEVTEPQPEQVEATQSTVDIEPKMPDVWSAGTAAAWDAE